MIRVQPLSLDIALFFTSQYTLLVLPTAYFSLVRLTANSIQKVYLDYAPSGARTHLRKFHPKTRHLAALIIQAEDMVLASGIPLSDLKDHYDDPRCAMFSVWRPLRTVHRDPLAISDCRAFPKEDYVPFRVLFSTIVHDDESGIHREEVFLAYCSDQHRRRLISNQLFDSEPEKNGLGVAGGVMDSSVDLEGTESEPARVSLEVRCTVMWQS